MYDAIVIGAGVTGCAVAQRLVQYAGKVLVIDRAGDVADGASKANSGIVHAGYDAVPGTGKARLNVKGARMFPLMCQKMGVPYGKPGALVLAFNDQDMRHLSNLMERAKKNDVPGCRLLSRDETLAMEPLINPDIIAALHVPESGIVSPYEFTCALADNAAENGAEFLLNTTVLHLHHQGALWEVMTDKGHFRARSIINCAGVGAGELHNQISSKPVTIIPRRGQYYLLDREVPLRFSMTIFQPPTPMGKGVLVSPTTHGNLLLGPNAEDIDDGLDTETTRQGLDEVMDKVRLTWPNADIRTVITTFSGIRAHEREGDFIIGAVEGAPEGAFEAIGIESPGLSAAPAVGEELGDWVAYWLRLEKNDNYREPTPLPKFFSHMSDAERSAAYAKDKEAGRIVCRCEQVTEAEVRHAIRRPVGARSLDAVKRRTRAGMGRCQGGFCSPRVIRILCEELGLEPTDVVKDGPGSRVLVSTLEQIAAQEDAHE